MQLPVGASRADGAKFKHSVRLLTRERTRQLEGVLKSQDIIIIDVGSKAGRKPVFYPGQVINSWGSLFF